MMEDVSTASEHSGFKAVGQPVPGFGTMSCPGGITQAIAELWHDQG